MMTAENWEIQEAIESLRAFETSAASVAVSLPALIKVLREADDQLTAAGLTGSRAVLRGMKANDLQSCLLATRDVMARLQLMLFASTPPMARA